MTAVIKGFRTRAQLRMRAPRSFSKNITPANGGCAVHHGGESPNPPPVDHAKCEDIWRGWQNYHMDGQGWVDIAYTSGYCNHGIVLAGRGYGVRTAANGTDVANQNYYAFVWIGGGGAKPSVDAINALEWLINDARKNGGAGNRVQPHSGLTSTSCPGETLRLKAVSLDNKAIAVPPTGGNVVAVKTDIVDSVYRVEIVPTTVDKANGVVTLITGLKWLMEWANSARLTSAANQRLLIALAKKQGMTDTEINDALK